MKIREVVRILEAHGFRLVRRRGSHRRYTGLVGGLTHHVTVAGKDGDDVSRPTLSSIGRQSGLPGSSFRPR